MDIASAKKNGEVLIFLLSLICYSSVRIPIDGLSVGHSTCKLTGLSTNSPHILFSQVTIIDTALGSAEGAKNLEGKT